MVTKCGGGGKGGNSGEIIEKQTEAEVIKTNRYGSVIEGGAKGDDENVGDAGHEAGNAGGDAGNAGGNAGNTGGDSGKESENNGGNTGGDSGNENENTGGNTGESENEGENNGESENETGKHYNKNHKISINGSLKGFRRSTKGSKIFVNSLSKGSHSKGSNSKSSSKKHSSKPITIVINNNNKRNGCGCGECN